MIVKVVTTGFLALGLCLLLLGPIWMGPRPTEQVALARYSIQFGIYLTGTTTCFAIAAFGAFLLMRRAKESFRVEAKQNLEDLIEGSLNAHGRGDEKTSG